MVRSIRHQLTHCILCNQNRNKKAKELGHGKWTPKRQKDLLTATLGNPKHGGQTRGVGDLVTLTANYDNVNEPKSKIRHWVTDEEPSFPERWATESEALRQKVEQLQTLVQELIQGKFGSSGSQCLPTVQEASLF